MHISWPSRCCEAGRLRRSYRSPPTYHQPRPLLGSSRSEREAVNFAELCNRYVRVQSAALFIGMCIGQGCVYLKGKSATKIGRSLLWRETFLSPLHKPHLTPTHPKWRGCLPLIAFNKAVPRGINSYQWDFGLPWPYRSRNKCFNYKNHINNVT